MPYAFSGDRGDHHIPEQDLGYVEQGFAHIALMHMVHIPEFGMSAVMEIAEYEDSGPPAQDSFHIADPDPAPAAIVLADLFPHAKIIF